MLGPIFFQNGPEHLIEIICAATHGAAQDAFLHGAELAQRAVGASVLQQHARLETMRADRSERERADEPGRVEKHARAARRRLQRRFPFGGFERGIELAHLYRADERTAGAMSDDVRKRLAGLARADELGGAMHIGYLPDMFGHVAQMPQILRRAGIATAVVWRGVPAAVDSHRFVWESPDGSSVVAEYLPGGYGNAAGAGA